MPVGYGPGDWAMSWWEAAMVWALLLAFAVIAAAVLIEVECGMPVRQCLGWW